LLYSKTFYDQEIYFAVFIFEIKKFIAGIKRAKQLNKDCILGKFTKIFAVIKSVSVPESSVYAINFAWVSDLGLKVMVIAR